MTLKQQSEKIEKCFDLILDGIKHKSMRHKQERAIDRIKKASKMHGIDEKLLTKILNGR